MMPMVGSDDAQIEKQGRLICVRCLAYVSRSSDPCPRCAPRSVFDDQDTVAETLDPASPFFRAPIKMGGPP